MQTEHITNSKDAAHVLKVKTTHYFISAIGLVTALSWNGTIKEIIKSKFPTPKEEIKANIVYTIIFTLTLILLIWILPDTQSELPAATRNKISLTEYEDKKARLDKEIYDRTKYLSGLQQSINKINSRN